MAEYLIIATILAALQATWALLALANGEPASPWRTLFVCNLVIVVLILYGESPL